MVAGACDKQGDPSPEEPDPKAQEEGGEAPADEGKAPAAEDEGGVEVPASIYAGPNTGGRAEGGPTPEELDEPADIYGGPPPDDVDGPEPIVKEPKEPVRSIYAGPPPRPADEKPTPKG